MFTLKEGESSAEQREYFSAYAGGRQCNEFL